MMFWAKVKLAAAVFLGTAVVLGGGGAVAVKLAAGEPESPKTADAKPGVPAWPANHPLDNLKPGEWYEAPNSHMDSVAAKPYPGGSTGVSSVMRAWCGGAYDTKRDRLMVWGGGHNDYAGNEVYAFDVKSLKWLRLTEPSKVEMTDSIYTYSDGAPQATHTYNCVFYLPPPIDRYCTGTCGGYMPLIVPFEKAHPGFKSKPANLYCLNLDTCKWEAKVEFRAGTGTSSAVDSSTGHVWIRSGAFLLDYDPVADKLAPRSKWDEDMRWDYGVVMDVDPTRKILVGVGKTVYKWDTSKPGTLTSVKVEPKGELVKELCGKDIGLAFHPPSRKFVAWTGTADVYLLDPDAMEWTKISPAATNAVVPTKRPAGTYGRFRYIPAKDVFIVVNNVNENVYFYKLPKQP